MIISTRSHELAVAKLNELLQRKEAEIAVLERRISKGERSRHEIIEKVRSVIEAAGHRVGTTSAEQGEGLAGIGYALPYLLSGRRHWEGPTIKEGSELAIQNASEIARKHGVSLPADPVQAVKAALDIALALINPACNVPLTALRNREERPQKGHHRGGDDRLN